MRQKVGGKEAGMVGAPKAGRSPPAEHQSGSGILGAGAVGLSHVAELSAPEAGEVGLESLPW